MQVLLGLVEPAQLALRDAALGRGVGQLPPRAELAEDRDRRIEQGDRLLEPPAVLVDPCALHRRHRHAELIADPSASSCASMIKRERGLVLAPVASG